MHRIFIVDQQDQTHSQHIQRMEAFMSTWTLWSKNQNQELIFARPHQQLLSVQRSLIDPVATLGAIKDLAGKKASIMRLQLPLAMKIIKNTLRMKIVA